MAVSEYEIKQFEKDRPYCDTANEILNLLAEKRLTIRETKCVLEKVSNAIERSINATCWNSPLVNEPIQNNAPFIWNHAEVAAEIKRRKGLVCGEDSGEKHD